MACPASPASANVSAADCRALEATGEHMADHTINADFGKRVIVHTGRIDWQPSPSPSVWRKRLDLTGDPERSRVTSVVRYDADSAFPEHPHPDGEEILVLDGVFSDEHGDYPAGSYLLNPEGFSHAPFSRAGCTLFVKLRQYPGLSRRHVKLDTAAGAWRPGPATGSRMMPLYGEKNYPEMVRLLRLDADCTLPEENHGGGAEIFVLDGDAFLGNDTYEPGTWVRYPAGIRLRLGSRTGCTLYLKTGHLAG